MEFRDPKSEWVQSLFDPSQPYLYVVVLPGLALFALGFRSQALMYLVGAVAFMVYMGTV
ncbi:MAG TPA: hypothetical protein VLA52_07420 [Thermohalobaculum sp.]|nr:hypothetical protein [Thermohalobaculum sp.]